MFFLLSLFFFIRRKYLLVCKTIRIFVLDLILSINMEVLNKDWELLFIDKDLLYKVLSIPSYFGQEKRMQEFLLEYAANKGLQASIDNKGNVYMSKGTLSEGEFYPCVVAHMDTVHESHIPYIEKNLPIPLKTDESNGRHIIYADGFGLGGDDKAGIVIALTIMERMPFCKAVFFVEEEIGCCGSRESELWWFKDVGYVIAFDSPGGNTASWSCNGECLFSRAFYEEYLQELDGMFGEIKYFAHPYTDVMILRMDTALACLNLGAGYYEYHTPYEYVVAEEMDKAVSIGFYLINRLGLKEHFIPFTSRYRVPENPDYDYFAEKFKQ